MRTLTILVACTLLLACGKKEEEAPPPSPEAKPTPATTADKPAAAAPAPVDKPGAATVGAAPAQPAEAEVVLLPVSDADRKASAAKMADIKVAAEKKDWKATQERAATAIGLDYKNYDAWYYKALALENTNNQLEAHRIYAVLAAAEGDGAAKVAGLAQTAHARVDQTLKTTDGTTRGGCRYPVTLSRAEARAVLRRISGLLSQGSRCINRVQNICDSGSSARAMEYAVRSCVRVFKHLDGLPDMRCKKFPEGVELEVLFILGKAAVAVIRFAELMDTIDRGHCG